MNKPLPTRRTLKSIARVVCPPQAIALHLVDDIVDEVERSIATLPKTVRVALQTGLTGYEVAALAWPGHLGRTASRLNLAQARRYFHSWWHSSIALRHEFAKGVKGLLCLACYEHPAMKRKIGYTPQEWIEKRVKYRLETYSDDIAKRRAALLAPDPLWGLSASEEGARCG